MGRFETTVLITLVSIIDISLSCKVLNWRHFPMAEILSKADIVVYGTETNRFTVPWPGGPLAEKEDSHFKVYCVLKNDNVSLPISEVIIVEHVSNRYDCSGTKVEPDTDYIVALSRVDSGNFEWDEVNVVPDGASFVASNAVLAEAFAVPGLDHAVTPTGRDRNTLPNCQTRDAGSHSNALFTRYWTASLLLILIMAYCI